MNTTYQFHFIIIIINESQVSRDERTKYFGITLERTIKISSR